MVPLYLSLLLSLILCIGLGRTTKSGGCAAMLVPGCRGVQECLLGEDIINHSNAFLLLVTVSRGPLWTKLLYVRSNTAVPNTSFLQFQWSHIRSNTAVPNTPFLQFQWSHILPVRNFRRSKSWAACLVCVRSWANPNPIFRGALTGLDPQIVPD